MSVYALLGLGSMGEAIVAGYVAGGGDDGQLRATVRRAARAEQLAAKYRLSMRATETEPEANEWAVKGADLVLLGVKPAQVQPLCRQISPVLSPDAAVVSVAGGVNLEQLAAALPAGQAVVRTMPNTPLAVGRGVVGYCANSRVSQEHEALVRQLFEPSGVLVAVAEELMAGLGAISGSGPAYVFYIAEALAAAARNFGFDEQTAAVLANRTVAGAGAMLAAPGADATALRVAVTSPNGSTERAIGAFEERRMAQTIAEGACAAAARSREVEAELG